MFPAKSINNIAYVSMRKRTRQDEWLSFFPRFFQTEARAVASSKRALCARWRYHLSHQGVKDIFSESKHLLEVMPAP